MKNLKLLLTAVFMLMFSVTTAFAYNFLTDIPVKGKTITDQQLQKDSMFTIYSFALRTATPGCENFSIADTKVSKEKANGSWEEIWTIRACDKNVMIPVEFTDKGSYFVNAMGVKYEQLGNK